MEKEVQGEHLGKPQNNNNDNAKTDKVEFTPHCTGRNQQNETCDTTKKQMMHEIRGRHKFGNDMAKSLESDTRHETKDNPWMVLVLPVVTLNDPNKSSQLHTAHEKEKNKTFTVHQDNTKKAHLLMHGHHNEAMQTQLDNDAEFKTKTKGDLFAMSEKIKLMMCNPSKVKCPCLQHLSNQRGC